MTDISTVLERLDETLDTANKIWFERKKFSVKHEDRLREKIRSLDLLTESLFVQLWELYRQGNFDDIDEVYREKIFNGIKHVTHVHYCDLCFHYVVTSKGKFLHGYKCDCDGGD